MAWERRSLSFAPRAGTPRLRLQAERQVIGFDATGRARHERPYAFFITIGYRSEYWLSGVRL